LAGRNLREELTENARRPLVFLREADPGQRTRIRLPLDAWLGTLDELRDSGPLVVELRKAIEALRTAQGEAVDPAVDHCLRLLEAFARLPDPGGDVSDSPAGDLASASTSVPATEPASPPASAATGRKPASRATKKAGTSRSARATSAGGRKKVDVLDPAAPWQQVAAAPLSALSGVGPKREQELAKFGLERLEDLLYHLPFRYEDRRQVMTTRDLQAGEMATLAVKIRHVDERSAGRARRRILTVVAGDENGSVELVWYNQIRWFAQRLKTDSTWLVHGKVEAAYGAFLRIVHPEAELLEDGGNAPVAGVVPVYEKPTAMPRQAMRRAVLAAVEGFAARIPDVVPLPARERLELLPMAEAFSQVHIPELDADLTALAEMRSPGHRSIVFEELFLVQLGLLLRKGEVKATPGIAFAPRGARVDQLLASLPFALTAAQERVLSEIEADMGRSQPMHRLVQGDVGSGKTIVAVVAALQAIESGYQAVIMAPTELLAEQHWKTVQDVAGGLGIALDFLSGEVGTAARREILPRLAAGEPGLVVGTHALIQDGVKFGRLGLAVIDEQHRFGVMQRAVLGREDGVEEAPDILLMTATPIPRTMALSVYGDLDLSIIDELPPGRKPVRTEILAADRREQVFAAIREEVSAGRQAYIVYPLIEESENSDLRDATSGADEIRANLPECSVALIHGRVPAAERERIMREFKEGAYQILVATTVIEVGIDVANATVMVIEHAERFGLSQLHQLRGRVGRGASAARCLLVADWAQSREARERLRVMTETTDGLRIAEADLAIRGPGAMLGTRQSGVPDFRVANILRDQALLHEARDVAMALLEGDPGLSAPESQGLRDALAARWAGRLGLARVG